MQTTYESRLEWVPVIGATVDLRAQGPFVSSRAEKIAANLDPDALGYPFVWKASDGRYYIIDGQHRFRAVAMALGEDQKIQCEVVSGITLERAAQLYRERNTARAARGIDKFIAGITARDPICGAINDIARLFGLGITRSVTEGGMVCTSSLLRIYALDGNRGQILTMTLRVATGAWGKDPRALLGDVLTGLALAIQRNPNIDEQSLIQRLAAHPGGSLGLLGRGRTLRSAHGGALSTSIARAVIMAYNAQRRKNPLPDWDKKTAAQAAASVRRPSKKSSAAQAANGSAATT